MPVATQDFISRWLQSEASERANYALFLSELCDYLDVPRPDPTRAEEHRNTYVFEKAVEFHNLDGTISQGRIDLYKRAHFVLEAKQGSNPPTLKVDDRNNIVLSPTPIRTHRLRRGTAVRGTHGWDEAMLTARYQAEQYAKALPASEGWPPFLVTVDVGHSIELYADFSLTGKAYLPFPDPRSYRILFSELAAATNRDRLRALWIDPHSLDPSRHTAKVTRDVAAKLATLARNLEQKFPAKQVAEFLTRCIFTSFAEDVKLLPEKSWLLLLEDLRDRDNAAVFPEMASSLWATMNAGGFSPILQSHILKFNGGLFESTDALPLTPDQLNLLIEAADSNWRDVEPAIFGTLLERALNPAERHALGAHYTPRAYVERLVIPTVVEPLRSDWNNTVAAIADLVNSGQTRHAIDTALNFHRKLCNTRVLDPACGSGNFLYVALEHMKRLEGEVIETLVSLGEAQQALEHTGLTVDPHQLLGIELNPRAVAVADLVLWIGYLQWHIRTRGDAQPPIPVIRNFHNIQHCDALMTWKRKIAAIDAGGNEIMQWDGKSWLNDPLTGRRVKDESALRPVLKYVDPAEAAWPEAEFVIGNPPYIGKGERMRNDLGDGYVEALQTVFKGKVSIGSDFVMFWWWKAANAVRAGKCRSMGLITTNTISQTMNRKVVAPLLEDCSFSYVIPNHPWVDSANGAQVRVALTALKQGRSPGVLAKVVTEKPLSDGEFEVTFDTNLGMIHADLRIGADVTSAKPLEANSQISSTGLILGSQGFVLTRSEAESFPASAAKQSLIFPLVNGQNLNGNFQDRFVIDTYGWTQESLRTEAPEIYQHLLDRVPTDRKLNRAKNLKDNWWLPRRSNEQVRGSIEGLQRYIATVESSKYRIFSFLPADTRPEHKLVVIGSEDAFELGVVSSSLHVRWADSAGGRLGVGDDPVYSKTLCFDPFPFPACTDAQKQTIRDLAERLDAHRKRQQQLHSWLTLTDMYNVLERLRANAEFTEQDQNVYQAGLIGVLRELHDELDRAVFDAYGWPHDLTSEQTLERLVVLNVERRAEEASGLIRWLRPEYQAPNALPVTATLSGFVDETPTAVRHKQLWPASIPDQFRVIKDALRAGPLQTPQQIAAGFRPAPRRRVTEILDTLTTLGQARESAGRYSL
jgi:hypothetical protein